jgi:hypothetical protein
MKIRIVGAEFHADRLTGGQTDVTNVLDSFITVNTTIGYNGFTTCFDSHESSSGYVQTLPVLAVLLLTVSSSGGCLTMARGSRNMSL